MAQLTDEGRFYNALQEMTTPGPKEKRGLGVNLNRVEAMRRLVEQETVANLGVDLGVLRGMVANLNQVDQLHMSQMYPTWKMQKDGELREAAIKQVLGRNWAGIDVNNGRRVAERAYWLAMTGWGIKREFVGVSVDEAQVKEIMNELRNGGQKVEAGAVQMAPATAPADEDFGTFATRTQETPGRLSDAPSPTSWDDLFPAGN